MRKQSGLIMTALLPVIVLVIGFCVVTSKAGLDVTVTPEEAEPFYGPPGVDGQYYGTEISSSDLCGVVNGFDTYVTSESASVSDSVVPNEINWHCYQRWDFTSGSTPWGNNTAEVTTSGLLNICLDVYDGFPWSGSESHSRVVPDDGDTYVAVYGSVTTWKRYSHDNEIEYVCPYSYKKRTTYKYYCDTNVADNGDLLQVSDADFGDPEFRPDQSDTLSRWSDDTDSWHDCIEVY